MMDIADILLYVFGGAVIAVEIVFPVIGGVCIFAYAYMRGEEPSISTFEGIMLWISAVFLAFPAFENAQDFIRNFTLSVDNIAAVIFLIMGAITLFFILRDLLRRDKRNAEKKR